MDDEDVLGVEVQEIQRVKPKLDYGLLWSTPQEDVQRRGNMATVEAATKEMLKNACKHLCLPYRLAALILKMEPLVPWLGYLFHGP
jgi:hypothetical protein